ncbi:dihydrolipoamide acetyltransferase family protein [Pedobacter arcticus]|uniref:dihydrolipoamide acetyltransferase family protein n=1 Tax=Pedobacter arcticus TaxID=752140 RepID=UPI0003676F43|nr:dihydrolipoamide acetyltransferase family protein [Pedobacter arcticus]
MAQYELLLPKMGESVAEATIIKWAKQPGDQIEVDDSILEIATDKVDSEVPSPVKGKLLEQLFKENEIAQVGDVIALIEIEGEDSGPEPDKEEPAVEEPESEQEIPYVPANDEQDIKEKISDFSTSERFYSPLVKSIAQEEGIDVAELDQIKGSGNEGRVTKDDLLSYITSRGSKNEPIRSNAKSENIGDSRQTSSANESSSTPAFNKTVFPAHKPMSDEIVEMDRMRKVIAEHMIASKEIAAHVTSFVEADVTNLVLWREKVKGAFEKREGEKITFTPIFVEAVTKAIKDMPMINISLNGSQIIKKKDINIGMAAALPNGNLIVPVIKNADQLSLVGLTKAVNDLAKRAKQNKLVPDEVKGGTFTLTNIGGFGNIMGTPIINQPQVAILAVGAIKKKPAVLETQYGDVIAIRHMMYLSLSYDHRIVDGALGGTFVKRVADYLEQWDVNREL